MDKRGKYLFIARQMLKKKEYRLAAVYLAYAKYAGSKPLSDSELIGYTILKRGQNENN